MSRFNAFAGWSYFGKLLRKAKEKSISMLSGEGADEVLRRLCEIKVHDKSVRYQTYFNRFAIS